jgi:PD-(D/E)XK endonuclease
MAQPMAQARSTDGAPEGSWRPLDTGNHGRLERCGYQLYLPFGENTRTDLVIDNGRSLARVQCKTGRLREGAVRFAVSSSYAHHRRRPVVRRHYHGEIDYFAVFCPETEDVYLIPIADLENRTGCSLRVAEPRSGQKRRIRTAADYAIGTVRARA